MRHYPIINVNEHNHWIVWNNYIKDLNLRINGLIDYYDWQKPFMIEKQALELIVPEDENKEVPPQDPAYVYYRVLEKDKDKIYLYNANSISYKEGFRVKEYPAYLYYGTKFDSKDIKYDWFYRILTQMQNADSTSYYIQSERDLSATNIKIDPDANLIYIVNETGIEAVVQEIQTGSMVYKITQNENKPDDIFNERTFSDNFSFISTSEARFYTFSGNNGIMTATLQEQLPSDNKLVVNFKDYNARWFTANHYGSGGLIYNKTLGGAAIQSLNNAKTLQWNVYEPIDCYLIYKNGNENSFTYEVAYCEENIHTSIEKQTGISTLNIVIPTIAPDKDSKQEILSDAIKIALI